MQKRMNTEMNIKKKSNHNMVVNKQERIIKKTRLYYHLKIKEAQNPQFLQMNSFAPSSLTKLEFAINDTCVN